jgi:hypothetical protein
MQQKGYTHGSKRDELEKKAASPGGGFSASKMVLDKAIFMKGLPNQPALDIAAEGH